MLGASHYCPLELEPTPRPCKRQARCKVLQRNATQRNATQCNAMRPPTECSEGHVRRYILRSRYHRTARRGAAPTRDWVHGCSGEMQDPASEGSKSESCGRRCAVSISIHPDADISTEQRSIASSCTAMLSRYTTR
ncbi:unnamed protein product [Diplocarpon coronariae]